MCAMSPKLLRPRASGFDPRTIEGLVVWLDALDPTTYTESSGQISEWRSKVGSIKFEQQDVPNNRPTLFESSSNVQGTTQAVINDRQAFYFDGNNDTLTGSTTIGDSQWTNFVVCRTDDTASTRGIFTRDPDGSPFSIRGPQFLRHSSAGVVESIGFQDTTLGTANAGTLTNGVAAVIHAVQAASTIQNFLNNVGGTAVGVTQNSSSTTPRIGVSSPGSNFWKGTVGEILLYNRSLNTAEQKRIYDYLRTRWRI